MKYIKKTTFLIVITLMIASCSTKKDTIITRNWHAINTKFNVLFNGKEAFKDGIEEINNKYKDDWFKQLPIEPIEFEEDKIAIPKFGPGAGFNKNNGQQTQQNLTTFEKAEEKAVKAIQKHGMNINGTERNRQIDDAYLLLGKARYYSQRFIPAIEAFNYVIANYPNADLIAETKIWRAKTNIRIDNEETAIESMKLLLVVRDTLEADLPDEIKEQAHTAMAMAYVKSDSLENAKKHLRLATRTLKNKEQGARNLFVLGQMYSLEGKKDSAITVFKKLIDFKKAPYKYKIHANIELARNFSKDSSSTDLLERFQKLIKNRDNRPFLDELYYQTAVLHENNDSIQLAIKNYNKSLRAINGSEKQKTFTYEKLGNLYFKNNEYQYASAYYDSVLKTSKDTVDLRIRRVKRKHKNLASLIKFEDVVTINDSILKLASMPIDERKLYFEKYIEDLKEADKKAAQLKLNQAAFGNAFNNNTLSSSKRGQWYFYNSQSLNFGRTEFKRIWGDRKLEDDWRWSEKRFTNTSTSDSLQTIKKDIRYDLDSYLSKIPSKKATLDSLKASRNLALYELGLIYKEQFKNPQIAIQRLERVATLNPDKSLILPINWHLYQIYKNLGNSKRAEKHKNVILKNYADTKFAQVILNPNKNIEEEVTVNEIENTYKEVYYLYKENKFEETISKIDETIASLQNSELIPKFELLKAYAIGKYKSKQAYKIALEYVAVSYGNTIEGKKAKEIIQQLSK